MSRDKTKAVTPRLRFPEFRDAGPWEVRRLRDGIDLISGQHLGPTQYTNNPSDYPYFTGPSDFTDDQGDVTKWVADSISPQLAKKGDVLVTVKGSGVGELWWLSLVTVAMGRQLMAVRGNKYEPGFLFYFLEQRRAHLVALAAGNMIPGLSRDDLLSLAVPIPPSLIEQQKIADCLSALDDLTRAEEARLEALQAHKKGLMQQLFPVEGETTPRLRFPEFRNAGPWEVKRLGELFSERNERNGAELELLSVTMSEGVVRASNLERRNNASSDRSNYKKVYPNDVVYNSMRMWQGASGVSYWNGIVSPAYTVVTPAQKQNPIFWAYYFKQPHTIEQFARFSQGVTSDTWNLKYSAFSTIRLSFPVNPCEQQKIADCLSSLDELIRTQGERIEALKQHKKGLMQQLFPQEVA